MSLLPNCREVTRLVLQGEDRRLSLTEQLRVRLHLTACDACTRFRQQVGFMRGALGQWRRYGGDDDSQPG